MTKQISGTVGIKEMAEKGVRITKEHKEAFGHNRYLHHLDCHEFHECYFSNYQNVPDYELKEYAVYCMSIVPQ